MLWLHIGDTDPSKGDSTDMRNTLCFEWITMMHKASLDKRKKHVYCISRATPSSLKEWWNSKKRPVDGSYSVKISWAQEISSHPCDFTAELRIPLLSVQHREKGWPGCVLIQATYLVREAPWNFTFRGPNCPGASTWGCPVIAWYGAVFTKSLWEILGFLSSWQSPKS